MKHLMVRHRFNPSTDEVSECVECWRDIQVQVRWVASSQSALSHGSSTGLCYSQLFG